MIHSNAISSLEEWIPKSSSYYRSKRNYDIDDEQTTSRLSASISSGVISEIDVLTKVHDSGISMHNNKFIEEIFWRIYFRGYFETHPEIWSNYKKQLDTDRDSVDSKSLNDATESKTDIDCFNAWVHQLKNNGFLHNHSRMWFASIWIFTLNLPWTLGCDLFMRYLVDTDEASNVLSWRWVAGLHTSKKPYVARPENIKKYTDKFNPFNQLNTSPKPIVEDKNYSFTPLNFNVNFENNVTLVMLDNFLEVESQAFYNKNFKDFFVLNLSEFNNKRIDRRMLDWRDEIILNISKKIKIEPTYFKSKDLSVLSGKRLVTNYQKSGYLNDFLVDVVENINRSAKLDYFNRKVDILSWNHCKGGYFKLKNQISNIVEELMQPSLFS